MAVGAPAASQYPPSRRRSVRYRVQAPLDVTVLRSGVPDAVPGRSVNLGPGGVAAVLAAELLPGEVVGLEIRLPEAESPLRTRARVRHHDRLRCGMEFVGLSAEQQAALRTWTEASRAELEPGAREKLPPAGTGRRPENFGSGDSGAVRPQIWRQRVRPWAFLLLSVVILLAVLWWKWNRGWEELESGLRTDAPTAQPQTHVPADVMQKLVRHRVDPDYPEAARPGNLQGVIALDVVVGRDGTVMSVRPLNGPEVLAQAAVDALRWWRFEPYRVNGQPVAVETTVAVEFRP